MSDINSWNTTDGSNNATPPDGFPENMAYSAVNNSARAVMGGMKRFFADLGGSLAGGGSADAYTVTLNAGYTSYFEGMLFSMSIPANNTGGACTLNVNAIGAESVVDASGNNPPAGALVSGGIYTFVYDGTNFQVVGMHPQDMALLGDLSVAGQLSVEGYDEDAASYTGGSGTKTLDLSAATHFYAAAALSGAVTFAFSNPPASGRSTSFVLELTDPGAATSITWPSGTEWRGGNQPTWTVTGVDIVSFVTRDGGTTWRGFLAGQDFS
jgi:hypothetical protein